MRAAGRSRLRGERAALVALLLVSFGCGGAGEREELVVFAAASLEGALVEVAEAYGESGGLPITFNFAASNALAQQLRAGGRADLFISADEFWMDFVDEENRLVPGTRLDLLGNRLVVVAHPDSRFSMERLEDLAGGDFHHLSLGDPDAVPVGRYAKAVLESVRVGDGDLWSKIEEFVVPAVDVRAALGLVEQESRAVGIVYRTDVHRQSKVRLVFEFPRRGAPIRYPAARVQSGQSNSGPAEVFLSFLVGPVATEIFRSWGFEPL